MSGFGVRGRQALGRLLVCPLLISTPFLSFVHHHDYALWRPEILLALGVFALLGMTLAGITLVIGAVSVRAGTLAWIALVAALIVLLVDVQTEWLRGWGWQIAATFATAFALGWLLRRHLPLILAAGYAAIVASTLLLPAEGGWSEEIREGDPVVGAASTPPLVVHLILDEHIGVEGIPAEFRGSEAVRRFVRQYWLRRGFRLFGKAYSRYYQTLDSIPNLLNFTRKPTTFAYTPRALKRDFSLAKNAYFELMARRGHRIHVYQTRASLDYCAGGAEPAVARCVTYPTETIKAIESSELTTRERFQIVTGMYVRLSFVLKWQRRLYTWLRETVQGWGLELPAWRTHVGRVSPVASLQAMDRLSEDLATARPGDLYFAHFLLPHEPYAYDRECRLRGRAEDWLRGLRGDFWSRRNTAKSRAIRYPLYLEQLLCTYRALDALFDAMQGAGVYDDAEIFVHGDHGSRLDMGPPVAMYEDQLVPSDWIDGFSTLLAVRAPGIAPGYDTRLLPLDETLWAVVREGDVPPGTEWAGPPQILIQESLRMLPRPMPDFSHVWGELTGERGR